MEKENNIGVLAHELEQKINKIFDEFRILPNIDTNIDSLLNISSQSLQKMSSYECNEVAYKLFCHNLSIQKRLNFLSAKRRWADNNLRFIVAKSFANYGGDKYSKYEVIRDRIVADNIAAKSLFKLISECDLECDALNFLSSRIKDIADTMNSLAFTKR